MIRFKAATTITAAVIPIPSPVFENRYGIWIWNKLKISAKRYTPKIAKVEIITTDLNFSVHFIIPVLYNISMQKNAAIVPIAACEATPGYALLAITEM